MGVLKMESNNLYEEVMSHKSIWSTMYGEPHWKPVFKDEPIIEISVKELRWFKDKTGFYYIWGWPGPDANRYTKEDYGESWAFTKEELEIK